MFGIKNKLRKNTKDSQVEIYVLKRDGAKQEYDPSKIYKVCEALGLSEIQSERLVGKINEFVDEYKNGIIPTNKIRERVQVELRSINEYYAEQFDWFYKMNKE